MAITRRKILQSFAAAAGAGTVVPQARAQGAAVPAAGQFDGSRRILIKGGYVVTQDARFGEGNGLDVLIDKGAIVAVGRGLDAGDADVLDAKSKLVLPGFVDTHRHAWSTLLRSMIAEGNFRIYQQVITTTLSPLYRPEDVYIGNLLAAVGALNSGITNMLDWSHAINSPQHADAAIAGLRDAGIRGVFAYGDPSRPVMTRLSPDRDWRQTDDIKRVQKQYFSSTDQLLTLAMALRGPESSSMEVSLSDIRLARSAGVRISMHVGVLYLAKVRAITKLQEAGMLGPDMTHVHTLSCTDDELRMIADSGGTISTSSATELMSAHGYPSIQRWKKFGLRPSLSVDNETRLPGDLFAQLRALVMSDHGLEAQRVEREGGDPVLVPMRDVLQFATLEGAKANGLDSKTGTLAPGKRADLILIDLNNVTLMPIFDPVSTAMMLAQASDVSWVFVDGKVRKREGKLVGVDIDRVRALAQASQDYLLSSAKMQKLM